MANEFKVKNGLIVNGTAAATDFNSTSDKRLKANILPIQDSITILNTLNPVSFNWKNNGRISYGLIAQEIEEILPELVVEAENGYKGISYIPLIALLIEAVKALDNRVSELESK